MQILYFEENWAPVSPFIFFYIEPPVKILEILWSVLEKFLKFPSYLFYLFFKRSNVMVTVLDRPAVLLVSPPHWAKGVCVCVKGYNRQAMVVVVL